jgi:hypothetical protein
VAALSLAFHASGGVNQWFGDWLEYHYTYSLLRYFIPRRFQLLLREFLNGLTGIGLRRTILTKVSEGVKKQMKNRILEAVMMLSLIAAFTIPSAVASAAAFSFNTIKADIHFDFTVGNRMFRAGKYTLRPVTGDTNPVIQIQSEDGQALRMFSTNSAQASEPKEQTALVFHRYGNQYFLYQVWTLGDTIGIQLSKSSLERQIEQGIVSNKVQPADNIVPATITLAASQAAN